MPEVPRKRAGTRHTLGWCSSSRNVRVGTVYGQCLPTTTVLRGCACSEVSRTSISPRPLYVHSTRVTTSDDPAKSESETIAVCKKFVVNSLSIFSSQCCLCNLMCLFPYSHVTPPQSPLCFFFPSKCFHLNPRLCTNIPTSADVFPVLQLVAPSP